MSFEQATNGFMARAMIFSDLETNPRRKPRFVKKPMSEGLANALRNLYAFGHYDMLAGGSSRIEHLGDKSTIPVMNWRELLNMGLWRFYSLAETQKHLRVLRQSLGRGYGVSQQNKPCVCVYGWLCEQLNTLDMVMLWLCAMLSRK